MGYTHYWTFKKQVNAADLKTACVMIGKLCLESKDTISLSGVTAHTAPGTYDGVTFNGARDDAHETFVIPGKAIDCAGESFFCKTAQKPYDLVVTAALCILQHYLGNSVTVSSDGTQDDWTKGRKLASKVLGFDVMYPKGIAKDRLRA